MANINEWQQDLEKALKAIEITRKACQKKEQDIEALSLEHETQLNHLDKQIQTHHENQTLVEQVASNAKKQMEQIQKIEDKLPLLDKIYLDLCLNEFCEIPPDGFCGLDNFIPHNKINIDTLAFAMDFSQEQIILYKEKLKQAREARAFHMYSQGCDLSASNLPGIIERISDRAELLKEVKKRIEFLNSEKEALVAFEPEKKLPQTKKELEHILLIMDSLHKNRLMIDVKYTDKKALFSNANSRLQNIRLQQEATIDVMKNNISELEKDPNATLTPIEHIPNTSQLLVTLREEDQKLKMQQAEEIQDNATSKQITEAFQETKLALQDYTLKIDTLTKFREQATSLSNEKHDTLDKKIQHCQQLIKAWSQVDHTIKDIGEALLVFNHLIEKNKPIFKKIINEEDKSCLEDIKNKSKTDSVKLSLLMTPNKELLSDLKSQLKLLEYEQRETFTKEQDKIKKQRQNKEAKQLLQQTHLTDPGKKRALLVFKYIGNDKNTLSGVLRDCLTGVEEKKKGLFKAILMPLFHMTGKKKKDKEKIANYIYHNLKPALFDFISDGNKTTILEIINTGILSYPAELGLSEKAFNNSLQQQLIRLKTAILQLPED